MTVKPVRFGVHHTYKENCGLLVGRRPVMDVLRANMSEKRYAKLLRRTELIELIQKGKMVPFRRELLGNPALDEKIAEATVCIIDVEGMKICDPETILQVRAFKSRPFEAAKLNGMGMVARRILSIRLISNERFWLLCILNHAIGLDEHTGLDTYVKVLQLMSRFDRDVSGFVKTIGQLWYIPRIGSGSEKDYALYHATLYPVCDGQGDGKQNYEDIKFVKALNELLRANGIDTVKKTGNPLKPWPKLSWAPDPDTRPSQ